MKETFRVLVRKRFLISQIIILIVCVTSCGGCVLCGGKATVTNSSKSGSIAINIGGLQATAPQTGHNGITSITCSGVLTNGSGGTGETTFSVSRNFEISRNSGDPSISRINLRPGTWTVTVSAIGWTTSCNGNISENSSNSFNFNYKNNGCNH